MDEKQSRASEAATSSPGSSLDRCLELLRPGTSDESKFIGLSLMSELLQIAQDTATMTRFFESMDFGFLDRMMQIDENTVPKDAGVDATTIRSIAIDIMACFATHWELLVRNEFKERVPTMLSLLSPGDETDDSAKILKIMIRISAYPQISMILTNPEYQSMILDYLLGSFEEKVLTMAPAIPSAIVGEAHNHAIMVCTRTFLIIQEGFKQNSKAVLQITGGFLPMVMNKISRPFSTLTEAHKPEILRLLTDSIAYLPAAYVQQHIKAHMVETRSWIKALKSGLIQLLSTRQAPKTRDDCFKLIGILLQRLGPEWLFPETSSDNLHQTVPAPKKKQSPGSLVSSMESLSLSESEINKKFAGLVVHLTCVEVRMLMDELANDLSSTAKPAAATLSEEDASQAKVRREEVLPLAYEILEVSIGYLVHVSESEESMDCGLFDATGLLKIQESLQATFTAILDYLRDLQSSKDAAPKTLASNMIYLASLRILSVWLMEDDSLHGQAASIVPTLEAVFEYW
ncbi:hypothetical protein BG011_001903 [Mortierella polycephala]|uniref:Neurochondrin-domain-containing protein n=1 Tax=Mortierella polycephala TaxID=41804 RepID=A0A9P6Q7W3_9FUNG|nr:hypothetical protein BG011_001903 [Mortierella polycephala]